MFWADRIAKDIQAAQVGRGGTLLVRDEKTMSGRVHIGSMRGVAIHAVVCEALAEYGERPEYRYEFNDFDPFDAIPGYLDRERFFEHLGKPLRSVPSPEPGFENYAEYFAAEFVRVHEKAGIYPTYYRAYEDLYRPGKMDSFVRTALEKATDVRRILKDISGSEKDESWLPVSVVCEACGKIMTTRAYDFDGSTVGYSCDKSTEEVRSCGAQGRVSPFGGEAKLFWKVDWAAKWAALGVGVEGGGKDHSTKGGSRDVANHIARELFAYEPPFDIPYEFFLVGGKKMSSSKGKGSSAKDMAGLFPSRVFRLALIGKDIREQVDVDPAGVFVPRTYDWYDELSEHVRQGAADDYERLFAFCASPKERAELSAPWQMRFRDIAFIVQMPHLDLETEAVRTKGEPLTAEERTVLLERAAYARAWLAAYAPEEYRYELQERMPSVVLSDAQKSACARIASFFAERESVTGEEVHEMLHALKTEIPIAPGELFSALYRIFLNRTSGPKAGWFLSVLPRDFVLARLTEASH